MTSNTTNTSVMKNRSIIKVAMASDAFDLKLIPFSIQ